MGMANLRPALAGQRGAAGPSRADLKPFTIMVDGAFRKGFR
jgi:hypothetical protein